MTEATRLAPPADLAERIALYLDDMPSDGAHSDAAGANCWELLSEAADALRAGPSEPIAQGQREALKEASQAQHWGRPDKCKPAQFTKDGKLETCQCRECAALAQPPVGACREALADTNRRDAQDFCAGAFSPFVLDISQYVEIVAQLLQQATDRALAPSAQEGEALEKLIREYARDLRRNSNGGDDYPWEWAKATADYLEVLIERASTHSRPELARTKHEYVPDPKYPWFCAKCGYAEHERLKHSDRGSEEA